ncbi:DUF4314 domain-containing protein, partial [bacterium 1xD42-62]|nr:DUF4314 domain-containing protein [Parablautia muri]
MKFPNRETVERVRREYPAGTRVELVRMDDVQAPPIGTQGTVEGVDDVAAHLFWLQINLIDCHRINRYNDISIEKE